MRRIKGLLVFTIIFTIFICSNVFASDYNFYIDSKNNRFVTPGEIIEVEANLMYKYTNNFNVNMIYDNKYLELYEEKEYSDNPAVTLTCFNNEGYSTTGNIINGAFTTRVDGAPKESCGNPSLKLTYKFKVKEYTESHPSDVKISFYDINAYKNDERYIVFEVVSKPEDKKTETPKIVGNPEGSENGVIDENKVEKDNIIDINKYIMIGTIVNGVLLLIFIILIIKQNKSRKES